jgi:hypothetical protein
MMNRSNTDESVLRMFVLVFLILTILSGSLNIGDVYRQIQSVKVEQKSKKSSPGDCQLPYEEQEKEVEDNRSEDRTEEYLALGYFLQYCELLFQFELHHHEGAQLAGGTRNLTGVPIYIAKRSLII